MKGIKNVKQGFTLLELLVVVLIIGILASIALPQYQMAVTKAKVATMLPLMRRWKDAMYEYKLQHGDYLDGINMSEYGEYLGVSWPSDWTWAPNESCGDHRDCENDYWFCISNEDATGAVYCHHDTNDGTFRIWMFQSDESLYEGVAGMIICEASGDEGDKVCKALGGKLLDDVTIWEDTAYKLN